MLLKCDCRMRSLISYFSCAYPTETNSVRVGHSHSQCWMCNFLQKSAQNGVTVIDFFCKKEYYANQSARITLQKRYQGAITGLRQGTYLAVVHLSARRLTYNECYHHTVLGWALSWVIMAVFAGGRRSEGLTPFPKMSDSSSFPRTDILNRFRGLI